MMSKVLLTGAFGYIGGRAAISLYKSGYPIICGTRRIGLSAPDWFQDMDIAILNWNSVDELTNVCNGIDCIVHLSAMNEIESARNPIGSVEVNGLASLRLLEAAVRAGVKRFIYFSTAHIYGAPLQGKITESTLPRPVHPYAITHKLTEDFVLASHDKKQIEGLVIRLSNGFGAPVSKDVDRWTLLVNDLCRQAVTSGQLILKSNGSQMRDFITLEDITRALSHFIQLDSSQIKGGLFNLGGGSSMSVLDMTVKVASRWKHLSGKNIEIFKSNDNLENPTILNYCCDKLFKTGFMLTSPIDQEIDDTMILCLKEFGSN